MYPVKLVGVISAVVLFMMLELIKFGYYLL